jgi:hypothetical protein
LMSVIKALYDDDVVEQAETYYQNPIPIDLIRAIRLTSLPPGTKLPRNFIVSSDVFCCF